jgi:hypothetical protein
MKLQSRRLENWRIRGLEVLDIHLRHYVTPPPAEDMQWHFLMLWHSLLNGNDRGNYHTPSIPPLEGGKFKRGTGFTLKGTSPDQVGNDRGNYHPPLIPPLEGGKFKRRTGFTLKGTSPDQVGNDNDGF